MQFRPYGHFLAPGYTGDALMSCTFVPSTKHLTPFASFIPTKAFGAEETRAARMKSFFS